MQYGGQPATGDLDARAMCRVCAGAARIPLEWIVANTVVSVPPSFLLSMFRTPIKIERKDNERQIDIEKRQRARKDREIAGGPACGCP